MGRCNPLRYLPLSFRMQHKTRGTIYTALSSLGPEYLRKCFSPLYFVVTGKISCGSFCCQILRLNSRTVQLDISSRGNSSFWWLPKSGVWIAATAMPKIDDTKCICSCRLLTEFLTWRRVRWIPPSDLWPQMLVRQDHSPVGNANCCSVSIKDKRIWTLQQLGHRSRGLLPEFTLSKHLLLEYSMHLFYSLWGLFSHFCAEDPSH